MSINKGKHKGFERAQQSNNKHIPVEPSPEKPFLDGIPNKGFSFPFHIK